MKQDEEVGEQTPLLKEEKEPEPESGRTSGRTVKKEENEKVDEKKKGKKVQKEKEKAKPKKTPMQVAKEEGLLLERPFGVEGEDVILDEEESKDFNSCIAAYEPMTKGYRAGNPTPLLLLVMHLGNALMSLLQLLGAWTFLTINAALVFPKCENHRLLDKLTGANTGHGWLCEYCSMALWTFPLVCGLFVPFFHYWDFCDTRLFYESLRNKLLVHFTQVPFWTNACIVYLIVHFSVGMMIFVFAAPESNSALLNMLKGVGPYLIPLVSFFIATYVTWDIKFFLITLAKYTDDDPAWSKEHLKQCLSASEGVVMHAYKNLKKKDTLPDKTDELFSTIHTEVQRLKDKNDSDIEIGKIPAVYRETNEVIPWDRTQALLFYQDGFWALDLLWSAKDLRGSQFRYSFRAFAIAVYILEIFMVYMIACTVLTYNEMQGHIDMSTWDPRYQIFSLAPFMISH